MTAKLRTLTALACVALCGADAAATAAVPTSQAARSTAQASSSEYEVKAACLVKFIGYVKWPEHVFKSASAPIVVAVVGPDPFGAALDNAFKNKSVQGRKIEIRRFETTADIEECHVLFVAAQEHPKLPQILEKTAQQHVLVVGESSGAAAKGASINFVIEDKKVRFEINVEASKRAELEISSQLLKLAKIVKDEGGKAP
jgi:hypothetical protein